MQELVLDDVYDIIFTSFWQTIPGYGILIFLTVVLLSVLVGSYYLIVRYRQGTVKDQILVQLSRLVRECTEYNGVQTYQELTTLLKRYAHWRFDVSKGVTDYELVYDLAVNQEQKELLKRVVSDAQAIKFGAKKSSVKQLVADIQAVRMFIEQCGDKAKVMHNEH